MDKFLLFENINLLKYRIEKIIKDMGSGFVESYTSHLLELSSLNKILEDAFQKDPSSHLETNLLVWNVQFEIGVPEVDREHQGILEQFAILYSLMVEGKGHLFYPKFLTFLKEYVEIHFSHEEALQKKINYPYYKKHALAHVQFKNQVLELLEQQSHKEITNKDLILLNLFVKKWLIHHILVEDKKIKQFLSPNK